MNRKTIEDLAEEQGIEIPLLDGLDVALVGYSAGCSAVYSVDKIIAILESDGMTNDEAWEWFDFNIYGMHLGEFSPEFIFTE